MERMRALILTLLVAACATVAQPPDSTARAQQQVMIAPAPYGLTRPDGMPEMEEVAVPHAAICADGWYSYNNRRRGTCAGHGGVSERGPRWREIR